jgi:hypothetical protein
MRNKPTRERPFREEEKTTSIRDIELSIKELEKFYKKKLYELNSKLQEVESDTTERFYSVNKDISNIKTHEHTNIDVLRKLDPSYFKMNADQLSEILQAVNKLILSSHALDLVEKLNNSIINQFKFVDSKLTFDGKEVYLKDINPPEEKPRKSIFKRLLSFKKGD